MRSIQSPAYEKPIRHGALFVNSVLTLFLKNDSMPEPCLAKGLRFLKMPSPAKQKQKRQGIAPRPAGCFSRPSRLPAW